MTLIEGAKIAVKTCMGVKKREVVLIITDPKRRNIAEALFAASQEVGAQVMIVQIQPRTRHGEEPPLIVADAMKKADVIFAPTTYSLSHTQARKKANRSGARIATMPGITTDMMSNGGMTADFNKIARTIKKVSKIVKNTKIAHITTEAGTDLTLSIEGRKWITDDTGICQMKGSFTNLPAGEIFIAPKEGTANGVLVIDGAFQDKLETPARVVVKDGEAVDIIRALKVRNMLDEVGKKGRNVAELGIGMNPASKIIGNVLEDEKKLGTIHIAFGDNSTYGGNVKCGVHIDGIILKPTLVLDDKKTILDKGELVV
jgi:leucyl aminopeptidase (aminopeptidase T)